MKILFLSNANSVHTKRWAFSLAQKGIDICIFSFEKNRVSEYNKYNNIRIIDGTLKTDPTIEKPSKKIFIIGYVSKLKKAIKEYQPDILHAHYASSYGLVGALSGFNPYIISVWGSDIYLFPKKSFFHKAIIKYNLSKADQILSTSHAMADETKKYTNKQIEITPFGIDLSKFKKIKVKNTFTPDTVTIGTVKRLSAIYGIDYLIKSFKLVKERQKKFSLKLLIVGDGKDQRKLEKLTEELNISNDVIFTGAVVNDDVPVYLNKIDIYVALSLSESFGVAIIEASACELPVVVSNVGGLPEVVDNNQTGYVVESKNTEEAAEKIGKLLMDSELRNKMGKNGRKKVQENYNWVNNVNQMISIYHKYVKNF